MPTGISRRVEQCIIHLQSHDCEGALINLFPAIDRTAKKRRPRAGVGERIKAFLADEEATISAVGTGNLLVDISVDGISIPEALYKFGRTPIAHEGELDPRLRFTTDGSLRIGPNNWELPIGYIIGMCIAVVASPENKGERLSRELAVSILGKQFRINEIWGRRESIEAHIGGIFNDHEVFARCRA